MIFRFGAVILFDVAPMSEAAFLDQIQPFVKDPFPALFQEELKIVLSEDDVYEITDGNLHLIKAGIPELKVVADILAKSVFLDHFEKKADEIFDRIEPLAERMQNRGGLPRQTHELINHIGEMLQIQHRLVGRAQVGEKPDVLWEFPELERTWQRLEGEYEISERQLALERKLELVSTTAETLLGMLQDRRTLRVEWYIVILIVIEIFLTLYEMFIRH